MEAHAINVIRSTLEGAPSSINFDGKYHHFHTGSHDKKNKSGWYVISTNGDFAAGSFGDFRTGETHKYNSHEDKDLSEVQRINYKKFRKATDIKIAKELKIAMEATAIEAAKICNKMEVAQSHPYLTKKKIKNFSNIGIIGGELVIPAYINGNLSTVQLIYSNSFKQFIKGEGSATGAYHVIGELGGTIAIVEGYATGATIHEATGLGVVVAFMTSNLQKVSKWVRKEYPSAKIIFFADNDEKSGAGEKAAKLAQEGVKNSTIKVCPIHSDYNDLHVLKGLEAVRDHILGGDEAITSSEPFKVLGRYDGRCYYLPKDGHIYDYAPASHNLGVLQAICSDEQYWKDIYPSDRDGIDVSKAVFALLAQSENKTYNPAMRRGRGAWHETNGNIIIHQGDNIFNVTTGVKAPVTDFHSEYFYNKAPAMKKREREPLNNADASKIIEICKLLPTGNPLNAYLLAGWIVSAQICGVMKWRPHLWITGKRGSGKSYTMDYIVKPLLNGNNLHVVSSTTEAGIRQSLGADAIPVIFDEAEGTGEEERRRIKKVLELARASSSDGGGKNLKGTANGKPMEFVMRSSFLFSSISSSVKEGSDKSRITHIEVDKAKYGNEAMFQLLKDKVLILDDDFCDGFYWRCVRNAAAIKANVEVFKEAAALFFNDRRMGDQLGTLIACAYSLTSQNIITHKQATAWLEDKQWQNLLDDAEESNDEEGLLNSILHGFMFFDGKRCSVWDMISSTGDAYYSEGDNRRKALANYGLKYQAGKLYIANKNDNLREMLKNTSIADNWAKTLQRLPDAKAGAPLHFAGRSSRCTIISLTQAQLDSMEAP